MDLVESAAEAILRDVLRGASVAFRSIQSKGEHDFDLRWPDGKCVAVEVTRSTDRALEETTAAVMNKRRGGRTIPRTYCKHPWWIVPKPTAWIQQVRDSADRYLSMIESAGGSVVPGATDRGLSPEFRRVEELGVEYAISFGGGDSDHELSTPTPDGGWFSPTDVVRAVEVEAWKDDNRKKLAKAEADEAHLFLLIHPNNFLAWVALLDGDLPSDRPELPDEINAVWAAAADRDGAFHVWTFRTASGWEDLGITRRV